MLLTVQSLSHVWLFANPWTTPSQASLSLTISRSLPSSCPLHQWCHPAISSSDAIFSFCPQSFPAPGSFPMSWLFASDVWPKLLPPLSIPIFSTGLFTQMGCQWTRKTASDILIMSILAKKKKNKPPRKYNSGDFIDLWPLSPKHNHNVRLT